MLLKEMEQTKGRVNMGNIIDLWHDDISFCSEKCDREDCFRNNKNIRDKTVPHSFIIGIPEDCPKKEGDDEIDM